jgi:hypothetical protein
MTTIRLGEKSLPEQKEESGGLFDGLGASIFSSIIEAIFGFFGQLVSGFLVGRLF